MSIPQIIKQVFSSIMNLLFFGEFKLSCNGLGDKGDVFVHKFLYHLLSISPYNGYGTDIHKGESSEIVGETTSRIPNLSFPGPPEEL